ncbi:MAG: hypothetical protein LUC17_05295 [Oscillospiraceae bacterium]|nr:hypothetical protein [Oscillospiraceae bacterium]
MMDDDVRQLKEFMDNSKNTVAVTGAGISYNYGMRRLKQQTSRMDLMRKLTPEYVRKHPDEFYQLMKDSFLDATFEKGPGPVHKQLAELEKEGKLQGIVTQNMDCLHEAAGSKNVIEFQGSFADNVCVDCGARVDDYTVWGHGEAPRCPKCGGPLMPSNFGRGGSELQERMKKAQDMIAAANLIMVMGTTGFRSDEYMAKLSPDTTVVQINPASTVFDQLAVLNIRRDAEKVFAEILVNE